MYGMSTPVGKKEIKFFLQTKLKTGAKILDVGAGGGTYYKLLGKNYDWSAIEIWHDTAIYLSTIYNTVYEGDVINFWYPCKYDLVIFGDVIEHLTVENAQECIERAKKNSKAILIAIPYDSPQGAIYGNEAEKHLQTGMTPEIFNKRYPGFKLILDYKSHAYYYWEAQD